VLRKGRVQPVAHRVAPGGLLRLVKGAALPAALADAALHGSLALCGAAKTHFLAAIFHGFVLPVIQSACRVRRAGHLLDERIKAVPAVLCGQAQQQMGYRHF